IGHRAGMFCAADDGETTGMGCGADRCCRRGSGRCVITRCGNSVDWSEPAGNDLRYPVPASTAMSCFCIAAAACTRAGYFLPPGRIHFFVTTFEHTATGGSSTMPATDSNAAANGFTALGVPADLTSALAPRGITTPTPI